MMDLSRHHMSLVLLLFVLVTFFSTALTRHRIRHHRDRFKRQQGAHLFLPGSYVTDGDPSPDSGPWSEWTTPSACSRTCGGGVSTQMRECYQPDACRGPNKKHFSCNTQDCPDDNDFRAIQCSEFDRQPFEGIYYKWIPYTKAPNPCELNCMPRGERFYYRHKKQVMDGTRCSAEKLDVCVEGKCQQVGCDMMLGSEAREDLCRQCGGNGTTCSTVTGLLDMQDLQVGYNDLLLIPAGATNIVVKEIAPSNNYLAVRTPNNTYYLNGNWRIDFPKTLRFAGCNFHYERSPQGFAAPDSITCLGPTLEPLYIVLLYQDVNVGVRYEYSIPKAISADPETYAWIFDAFTPCTATCGGGFQSRNVSCAGRRSLELVEPTLCDASTKPVMTQTCAEEPCTPQWTEGPWNECSQVCGDNGTQTREIRCEQIVSGGVPSVVNDQKCIDLYGTKPITKKDCNRDVPCPVWFTGPWKPCDHLCGNGKETRTVTCYRKVEGRIEVIDEQYCKSKEEKPESEKTCSIRPCEGVDWVASEWSGCDKCGLTNETRKVHCATQKGEVFPDELCEGEQKPELVRACETSKLCETQWYASQWSECSAKCGSGVQTRNVFCGTFEGEMLKKLDDSSCDSSKKYDSLKNCTAEVEECTGEWFSGPWSKCDKECGAGTKTRKVICMKEEKVIPTSNCDPNTVPFSSDPCNTDPCGDDEVLLVNTTTSVEEKLTTMTDITEPDFDKDVEDLEDDECLDGEWVYDDYDNLETFERLLDPRKSKQYGLALSTDFSSSTETSWFSEDLMLSDSTAFTDGTSISDLTSEGSGDTSDTSGSSSSDLLSSSESTVSGLSTESTIATTEEEGSGESTIFETTESSSDITTVDFSTELTGDTSTTGTDATYATDTTDATDATDATGATDATSESTIDPSTVDTTIDTSTVPTTIESTDNESSPSSTESTESTTSFSTESSTSESTSETTPFSTVTSDLTTETSFSTDSSSSVSVSTTDFTSDSTTIQTTEQSVSTPPDIDKRIGESDFGAEEFISTSVPETTESEGMKETTEFEGTSESTVSGSIEETTSTGSTEETTSAGSTEETTSTGSTEETTVTGTTESESTDLTTGVTTESSATSETTTEVSLETTTELTGSTESTQSTEFQSTETTESVSTESTPFDIWSSTETTPYWSTTPYSYKTVLRIKPRKKWCKRKPKPSCKTTQFGCCYDLITPAEGPFDKGCPTPKTCNETQFGCCPDGVSPALGPKHEECPEIECAETLFGCCADNKTVAKGNDFEGCEIEPVSSPATSIPDIATTEVGDCSDSEYGCCPDGRATATGEHFQGCDVIDQENCTRSYFGCCPDNKTAALGPDYQGCRMACEDEPHGCCGDKQTPAHGPNQEGCCLAQPFGCCPDNILSARGPNLEGCGCQYSPFGCCPDNVTAARGYGNEGCGCQHTAHGCCPDGYTPAAGPEYQGCACHTFQFGCCPDGISAARGPHKQGCGCRNTQYGCCSDDQTPAQGPNFTGCDCSSSKYGCCPDGVTDAQSENFDGCLDVPLDEQKSCVLEKDRGSCRNYTVKWFFDMQYGGCSRFWYGGCDGNTNRFTSMEECKNTCVEPKGKEVCLLPKVSGACEGYYPSWYYDKDRNHCAQFIWGGCLGNANRFETSAECQSLCLVDRDQDACEQPKETGPCNGTYQRWYFNKETDICEQFIYGGCKANNNNFPTESACKQQCLQPGRKKDVCALPRAQGNCTEREPRWYFDASENRCMPFYYSGCGGNGNQFISREACELDCPTDIERDTCTLPALGGECHNYTQRWYYDTKDKICRQFYYGGCGGNENNFHTEQACQQRCTLQTTTTFATPPPAIKEPFKTEHCFLRQEAGQCQESLARWFYDSRDGVCKQFLYTGCSGNANNFETREECHHRCSNAQDLCNLPLVVGPCNSDYLQWFYDKRTDTCQEFNYGGCQGNDNRFNDQRSCEQRCRKSSTPAVTESGVLTTRPTFTDRPREPAPEVQICYTPVSVGNCSENVPAWFYNAASQKCEAFIYTGCGGNANRFVSEEQCERHCGRFRGLDVCSHPKDTGACGGAITKWYYDRNTGRCHEFPYGGCDGSGNRFSFVDECESVCVKLSEPERTINDTDTSHLAICRLPVEVGPCEGRYHQLRWYFDDDRGSCVSFIYSGCGGNQNNFKTHQACVEHCHRDTAAVEPPVDIDASRNEVGVDVTPAKDPCEAYREECSSLLCPYGTEGFVDAEDCNRCRCYDPCRDTTCPERTVCTIDLNPNASMPEQTQFIAACRPTEKPGECPQLSSNRYCSHECRTDADCSGELKCCPTNCGASCVVPVTTQPPPAELQTTYLTAYTEAPQFTRGESPVILDENIDTHLEAEEGNYVTLKCTPDGVPKPTISWQHENKLMDGSSPRHRILPDGSLQIVGLYESDTGAYQCIAENGVGHPAKKSIQLNVTDATPHPANVIGDEDAKITVTLGAPYSLRCYAFGWPRPSVTWWRGSSMLPFLTQSYEQKRDNTLLIHTVKLSNLGVYTCQAYNGLGKAASWSLTVQSHGPVFTSDPEDEPYKKFLIPVPDRLTTTPRPVYPYRPTRPMVARPVVRVTPQPHVPEPYTEPSPEIVAFANGTDEINNTVPEAPRIYIVPVRTNITLSQTTYGVDSDVSIPCDVVGHPIPRVQWFKNGVPLEPSESIQISESNRLTIIRANSSDSGDYMCAAENKYSKSSTSVHIQIEGNYIHPNCTDNPFFANCNLIVQARYCTHKYYARFCCRSCTQAGQLPSYGPHLNVPVQRQPSTNLLS